MGIIAHVYRNPDQTRQTYINEYDEAELDRLEAEDFEDKNIRH